MEESENIKVDCKEITPEGKLICSIYTEDVAEMLRRGIKPLHTELNVKDKELDSSQSTEENKSIDGTKPTDGAKSSDEAKPTDGAKSSDEAKPTDGAKSSDEAKPTDGAKSSDEAKPTKADSSNKQGCGCSITKNEVANFLAKFQIKKEEN